MEEADSPELTAAGSTQSSPFVIDSASKTAIERALVGEIVRNPEAAMSFSRIFNKDAPDFSRIFSRGGTHLADLTVRELTTMEDVAFGRFAERLRRLQTMEDPSAG
jgi:hypothetical protein